MHIWCEIDITGICGERNRLLPEANGHPAGHTARERQKKKRDRKIKSDKTADRQQYN